MRKGIRGGAWAICAAAAVAGIGCADEPAAGPAWVVTALSVQAPEGGGAEGGLQHCSLGGDDCVATTAGEQLAAQSMLKSTRGASAVFDLGSGLSASLSGEAAIVLEQEGEERTVALRRGTVVFQREGRERAALPDSEIPVRLRIADCMADLDPAAPVSLSARVEGEARAAVTVRRGTLRLCGDTGELFELRAGQSARLAVDDVASRRPLWAGNLVPVSEEPPVHPGAEEHTAEVLPRGLGTMTARVPGTNEVAGGVRLVSHRVRAVVRDGFARTEVEEVFQNDTARVLEGRYVFPLPPGASISRLALWVGDTLVEGEMVERSRAARIFQGIVDDTVRPRDPALLEWVSQGEFSLKIFPIPAHGSRKVVLAYDETLSSEGNRLRYAYPLSLGADRAVTIQSFSISVAAQDSRSPIREIETPRYAASIRAGEKEVTAQFDAEAFTPGADFVVSYQAEPRPGPQLSVHDVIRPPDARGTAIGQPAREERFFALRIPVANLEGGAPPAPLRHDRAIVLDRSHSQSKDTWAGEVAIAMGLLQHMDEDERFVVLACDTACDSYPDDGLARVSDASIDAAENWLNHREIGGATDLAGALVEAARRLEPIGSGQVVYVGDGSPSAGELSVETIAGRVGQALSEQKADLRLLGAGRSVDELLLGELSRAVGASYERVSTGEPLSRRIAEMAMGLRSPVMARPVIELPDGLFAVYPKSLPNLRMGQEVILYGMVSRDDIDGEVKLTAEIGGAPVSIRMPLQWTAGARQDNSVLSRQWAEARIAELSAMDGHDSVKETIALSRQHHVMSRYTSLLVLENDRMFADFGIARTQHAPAEPGLLDAPPIEKSADPHVGAEFAQGGLGLSGVGEGGGGKGEGIGLGSIGTIGKGAGPSAHWGPGLGSGTGMGFGSGHGRLGGSHRVKPPQVRMGATTVSGRLPPEVIQRIVRQNFGRFRLCYENGLRNNPNLQGRVAVRFVIDREGRVANAGNGGSDLTDSNVVSCVVRAFFGLSFPQPEGGIVTVVYPIVFNPGGDSVPSRSTPEPSRSLEPSLFRGWAGPAATHSAGTETWRAEGEARLRELRRGVEEMATSRKRHEDLIRGLLVRGRFPEALDAARRFAELDPDLDKARELLAYAAAAQGERDLALRAIASQVETSPRNAAAHSRAARAHEAAGDERRACAHWRSLAQLKPADDESRYQSFRCRSRTLGEREVVLAQAKTIKNPGKRVAMLLTWLEKGRTLAYDADGASPGQFEAKVACENGVEDCPTVVVISPNGTVMSPFTPAAARSGPRAIAFSNMLDGTYRTLLVGGAPDARGDIEVRAHSSVRKFPIQRGGLQTVATTMVTRGSSGSF